MERTDMMGHAELSRNDFDIDLESGGTTSEEDGSRDLSLKHTNKFYIGLDIDGPTSAEDVLDSYKRVSTSGENLVENVELWPDKSGQEVVNFADKKMEKDKRGKGSSKLPSKPPRHPRAPSFDAVDIKLIREISELAALKRKRAERIKSRKMKAEKSSSSNTNLLALIVTAIFCFVIIFQGFLGSRV